MEEFFPGFNFFAFKTDYVCFTAPASLLTTNVVQWFLFRFRMTVTVGTLPAVKSGRLWRSAVDRCSTDPTISKEVCRRNFAINSRPS